MWSIGIEPSYHVSKGNGTRMPPTGPLDPAQIETIRNWIDQGAECENIITP